MAKHKPWDGVSPAVRSTMRANRSKDTGPEMVVRRMLHAMGFRYRLHLTWLPGRPDVVFTRRRKVVFVHGCFWHHHDCQQGRLPKTRREFWQAKLEKNRGRDERNVATLREAGWDVLVVWECGLTDQQALRTRLIDFLNDAES